MILINIIILILCLILLLLISKWGMEKFGVPNDIKNIILILITLLVIAGKFAGWYTMSVWG